MGRALCQRCTRPETVCVCKALPDGGKIDLQTKVMVVQHPCECKKKMIGTVPLMDLVLANFELVVARGAGPVAPADTRPIRHTRHVSSEVDDKAANNYNSCQSSAKVITIESKERKDYLTGTLDKTPSLQQALSDSSTLILYPGPGAVDIESLPLKEGKARTLIVVDGTWRQAGRVMREKCIADAVEAGKITRVQFAKAGRSDYKFRKEPKKYCISSLESVAYCLRFLENTETGALAVKHLLDTFCLMVSLSPPPPPAPHPHPHF
jgi:DTW domain-containing protein YfiP